MPAALGFQAIKLLAIFVLVIVRKSIREGNGLPTDSYFNAGTGNVWFPVSTFPFKRKIVVPAAPVTGTALSPLTNIK